MLKRLWPYVFPLLFLPNLTGDIETRFGVLEMSDWLIGPYLILLWTAADLKKKTLFDRLIPLILAFLGWAFVATITINLRYDYPDDQNTQYGMLKLAKFVLYGLAGYLTSKCLATVDARRRFGVAIVAAGLVLGVGAILVGSKSEQRLAVSAGESYMGYKAVNAISVYLAMVACYLAGLWSQRKLMTAWVRQMTLLAMLASVIGSAVTEGRGGWIAGMCGLIYLLGRGTLNRQIVALMIATPLVIATAYSTVPVFRHRVDITLHPVDQTLDRTGGIDNGDRFQEWAAGISQFRSDPILGTGFFHRGGNTAIFASGSHNFFLQMFLETGLPGGLLIILIFRKLWKEAGSLAPRWHGVDLPVKAAMVAAVAGGMGGEYFYGGIGLLTFLSLYSICGSMPPVGVDGNIAAVYPSQSNYAASALAG